MQVIFKMLDGTEYRGTFRVPVPMADRAAFEEHFQRGSAVLGAIAEAFETDEEGKPVSKNGNPKLKEGADLTHVRDEYMAFLAWRSVRRTNPGIAKFSEFIDNADELDFVDGKPTNGSAPDEDDVENPTVPAASTT
jgi:hypothetical protein